MPTEMTLDEWDRQFRRQAAWTRATRNNLYRRANLMHASRVLDVGSGTGAVSEEVAALTHAEVSGVDIDPAMVAYARAQRGRVSYRQGDGHDLPFAAGRFDVVVCHFLLLWCHDARRVASEMLRVTRPGGAVLVCAEPDYGGRLDYPDLPLGRWQAEALRGEGADPLLGRKLRALFAGRSAEIGVIPGLWDLDSLRAEIDHEWALWTRSLSGLVPPVELARVEAADRAAVESGERLVFMPVFFALVRA
jgi:SAM-dependent methyltransferase